MIKYSFLIAILIIQFQFSYLFGLQKSTSNEYHITLKYDTINQNFKGNLHLSWFNNSSQDIYNLPFEFLTDSTMSQVRDANVDDFKCEIEYSRIAGGSFRLKLTKPIKAGQSSEIRFTFETKREINYLDFGLGDPLLPTIQYFDSLLFNSNFQVHSNYKVVLIIPVGYEVATTGIIVNTENVKGNFLRIHTEAKDVPKYGIIISNNFKVEESISMDGILIRSLYNEGEEYWGGRLLEYAKDVIEFYVDTIGFYPQSQISLVPGETGNVSGGWPIFPNIVAIHRGGLNNKNAESHAQWITSHEIGHQYWGFNYVLEPINYPQWYGISMGIYTDMLYAISRKTNRNYNWFFNDYINGLKKGYNTTVMQTVDSLNNQNFNWNSIIKHGKSFAILRMLAYEIGEDKFFEVFKYCLDTYKGVNVTLELFQQTCEQITQTNLNWFFEQWYRTDKFLDYEITSVDSKPNKQKYWTNCKIVRNGNAVVSSIDVRFQQSNGEMLYQNIDGTISQNDLAIESVFPVEKIIIDPDKKYPLVNRIEWIKPD